MGPRAVRTSSATVINQMTGRSVGAQPGCLISGYLVPPPPISPEKAARRGERRHPAHPQNFTAPVDRTIFQTVLTGVICLIVHDCGISKQNLNYSLGEPVRRCGDAIGRDGSARSPG